MGSLGFSPSEWNARATQFLQHVPLHELLGMLESSSKSGDWSRVDLVADVLRHLLRAPVAQAQLSDAGLAPRLAQGVRHPLESVRRLAVRQIRSLGVATFRDNESRKALSLALAKSLHDEDTGIASEASEALAALATEDLDAALEALRKANSSSDSGSEDDGVASAEESVAQLRELHICARIAAASNEALKKVAESGLLQPLLDIVRGDDILAQMNALILVPLVAATDAGLEILQNARVVDILAGMAGLGADQDPILGDEALRVMSQLSARSLAKGDSEAAQELANSFLLAMRERLDSMPSPGSPLALGAMEMLGAFAGAQPPRSMHAVVEPWRQDILLPWMQIAAVSADPGKSAGPASIAMALRGGALLERSNATEVNLRYQSADDVAFTALLEESAVKPSDDDRAEAAELGRDLFLEYGKALRERTRVGVPDPRAPADVVSLVVDKLREPIDEQRCAVFALLRIVALQAKPWGLRAIYGAGAEVERQFLDRSLAMSKEAKEWRFAFLEAVHASPFRDEVLGESRLNMLRDFLRRGPFRGPSSAPVPEISLGEAA